MSNSAFPDGLAIQDADGPLGWNSPPGTDGAISGAEIRQGTTTPVFAVPASLYLDTDIGGSGAGGVFMLPSSPGTLTRIDGPSGAQQSFVNQAVANIAQRGLALVSASIVAAGTVNLPSTTDYSGRILCISRTDTNSAAVMTLAATGGETVDGGASITLESENAVFLYAAAGNWVRMAVSSQAGISPTSPLVIPDNSWLQVGTGDDVNIFADGANAQVFSGAGGGLWNWDRSFVQSFGSLDSIQVQGRGLGASTDNDMVYTRAGTGAIFGHTVPIVPSRNPDNTTAGAAFHPTLTAWIPLDVDDGATGDLDFPALLGFESAGGGFTVSYEVIDVYLKKRDGVGGAGDTIQLQTTAGAVVSDAMDINGAAVGDIVRASSITEANATFAAGAQLRVRRTQAAGNVGCQVWVQVRALA